MQNIIYINFIGIDTVSFFDINGYSVEITIINSNNVVLFQQNFEIFFDLDKNIDEKKYFIRVNKYISTNISESNISIKLPNDYYFKYNYYKNEKNKSIIIYKNFNYIPLIYLGSVNLKYPTFLKINYKFKQIGTSNYPIDCSGNYDCDCDCDCSGNYDGINTYQTTLFDNYFGNDNYYLNTLKISGDIWNICISDVSGIIGYNENEPMNTYKLFKIKNNMEIGINTNIYFYDDNLQNLTSYIIYLNTYNFLPIKNIPQDYENIIVNINYTNDSSGSIYNSILTLNMQTFNPDQICNSYGDTSGNYYYNCLFFKNYINPNYTVESINIFSYDYDKYFHNTLITPELNNINYYQINLYEIIIDSDTNMNKPIIFNIPNEYLFMNLDFIKLQYKLINMEFANNYFYKFTKSNKINLETLRKYLVNFIIKEYNVFRLDNILYTKLNTKDKKNVVKNYIYYDEQEHKTLYEYKNPNNPINFNNNIVNCIRCKLVFYYKSNTELQLYGNYAIDTKLFLNNYNLELYNKKLVFENIPNDEQKNKLIDMLLFLQTTTYQIKLYFYNKKNSVVTAYYLFNQVNLFKIYDDFDTQIDLDVLNNTYTNGYLKFNINIKKQYYILFLYADVSSFLNSSNFDELIFLHEIYTFKIFKINTPNGNLLENKLLFYICFQNLKELNIFMKFIEIGIMDINNNTKLSNYFNIPISKTFYNYYDLNNYWVINESSGNRYKITFSINKLHVNQIYLYGDMFIQTI